MRKYLASILIFTMCEWFCSPLLVLGAGDAATSTEAVLGMDNPAGDVSVIEYAMAVPAGAELVPVDVATTTSEVISNGTGGTENTKTQSVAGAATTTDELAVEIEPESKNETAFSGADIEIDPSQTLSETITETIASDSGLTTPTSTADILIGEVQVLETQVLVQWIMTGQGTDDDPAEGAQVAPSGVYQKSAAFRVCGIVSGLKADGDVYGQVFYPKDVAFGANDIRGRIGCGQTALPLCRMKKMEVMPGFDLFCKNLKEDNSSLPKFLDGNDFDGLCQDGGELVAGAAAVYCCDESLAYDDISGIYEAGVMATDADDQYSNTIIGQFEYMPQTVVEVNFGGVDYGKVSEDVRVEAVKFKAEDKRLVSLPILRNVGNTRAQAWVWQDDMGVGVSESGYNIAYGIKAGDLADWIEYDPFIWTGVGNVLDAGSSMPVEFSTTVINYPEGMDKRDFRGNMKVEAKMMPHYGCDASAVSHQSPDPVEPIAEDVNTDVDIKIENDANSTTTKPLI